MENSLRKILVVLFFLIIAAGCGKKQAAETEIDFTRVTNVEVYTVMTAAFEDYITLPVVVVPNKTANIGLTAGGKVAKIHVDKGDHVTKDMILLETDDVLLKAQYELAAANLAYQKKEFARSEKLFKDGTISSADFDGSELQLATTQSSYDIAKKQYEDATLKASFAGTVTMRNVEVGDILGPGMPAFRIIDMNRVKVQAGIPEKHIVSFKVGNTVTISFDAIPDRIFEGKINYISPEAAPSVRTFLAEIMVDNSGGIIKAGIMGNARILRTIYEDALMIPINAIVESQHGRSVFVAGQDNTAEEREIVLGQGANDTMVLVAEGIQPGDKVIVKGQQDLVTGESITITGEYVADSGEGSEQ